MRVLLINPPYPVCESLTMPLGLLYLAARLEETGTEVSLEDLQLCRSPIRRALQAVGRAKPRVAGITSFSLNLGAASGILRAVKRSDPEILTVWGGPHVSFDDVEILRNHPWVDAVVRGEGEETLLEIVDCVKAGKGPYGVAGVTWRDRSGEARRNPPRPFRENLDDLPRPSWHLLKLPQYRAFGQGASIMTSRGCPHRCIFCVGRKMIGARGRFRDLVAVVDEMEALAGLGFRTIRVEDDLFTFRRERALAICDELSRRGLTLRWRAYARVDTVDPELLRRMKAAGCERVLFGAESGSGEILARARKGITPEQTRRAVEMARKEGVGVLASFVLGLPGETPQTLRQTVKFARSLGVPYTLNLMTPYVGTEIREKAGEWGIRILSSDWRRYGQGQPVTESSSLPSRHLALAAGRFRRELRRYLQDLLEAERQGTLDAGSAAELERSRHWDFLRRVIREEVLERFGSVNAGTERDGFEELARSIGPQLRMAEAEAQKRLAPLVRDKLIRLADTPGGGRRWAWAES